MLFDETCYHTCHFRWTKEKRSLSTFILEVETGSLLHKKAGYSDVGLQILSRIVTSQWRLDLEVNEGCRKKEGESWLEYVIIVIVLWL